MGRYIVSPARRGQLLNCRQNVMSHTLESSPVLTRTMMEDWLGMWHASMDGNILNFSG